MYLKEGILRLNKLQRGNVWLDTGTFDSLYEASAFVEAIEKRSGTMVCCPEEIAFNKGWITKEQLYAEGKSMEKNEYGKYLMRIAEDKK